MPDETSWVTTLTGVATSLGVGPTFFLQLILRPRERKPKVMHKQANRTRRKARLRRDDSPKNRRQHNKALRRASHMEVKARVETEADCFGGCRVVVRFGY